VALLVSYCFQSSHAYAFACRLHLDGAYLHWLLLQHAPAAGKIPSLKVATTCPVQYLGRVSQPVDPCPLANTRLMSVSASLFFPVLLSLFLHGLAFHWPTLLAYLSITDASTGTDMSDFWPLRSCLLHAPESKLFKFYGCKTSSTRAIMYDIQPCWRLHSLLLDHADIASSLDCWLFSFLEHRRN
jgi:hypothetical protein